MTVTLLDILMILALGVLAGCGTGLPIGLLAGKQTCDWATMQKKDKKVNILLVLSCSAIFVAVLAWYVFRYPAP